MRPIGIARQDSFLSLEDSALAARVQIIVMASHLYRSTLIGNAPPVTRELFQAMAHPEVGDLVVEQTITMLRIRRDPEAAVQGLGYLLETRTEGHEQVWYVQYGPAPEDVVRWVNAMFIAIPTADNWFS